MDNLITQIKQTTENFITLELEERLKSHNFSPWNNLNKDRLLETKGYISEILAQIEEQDLYSDLSFNIVNALNTHLNTAVQRLQQLKTQPNQTNFTNT